MLALLIKQNTLTSNKFLLSLFFKQKATSSIAATSFPNTGLTQPTLGLVAGDRGCLPTVSDFTDAILQTAKAQLTLMPSMIALPNNLNVDYAAVNLLLCSTSGTCCTTDLCNTMSRVEMSFAFITMSIALALLWVF